MKKLLLSLLICVGFAALASAQVRVLGKIYDKPSNADSIRLYELMGLAGRQIAVGPIAADGSFTLSMPSGPARFYGLGFNGVATAKLILGEEPEVKFYALATNMGNGRSMGSPANLAYEGLRKRVNAFREADAQPKPGALFNESGAAEASANRKAYQAQVQRSQQAKQQLIDSLKTANPLLWRVATLQFPPDYFIDKRGHGDEAEFYGNEYFSRANLSDAGYENIPDVFDAFKLYAQTLVQKGAYSERALPLAQAQLAKLPANSKVYRMALGGMLTGFQGIDNINYITLAQQYVEKYRKQNLGDVLALDLEIARAGTYMPGLVAPDLAGPTPDNSTYSLKQMRGKVVLVDFWASWCGPCRRENPNVKALYSKYKDKGFEILGVSLDRDGEAWKAAIAADGLPWPHISDLKGWQSDHAALYSVTSIPQTILLDRDGKIIQRNLRGEALESKLREVFGE